MSSNSAIDIFFKMTTLFLPYECKHMILDYLCGTIEQNEKIHHYIMRYMNMDIIALALIKKLYNKYRANNILKYRLIQRRYTYGDRIEHHILLKFGWHQNCGPKSVLIMYKDNTSNCTFETFKYFKYYKPSFLTKKQWNIIVSNDDVVIHDDLEMFIIDVDYEIHTRCNLLLV